MSSSWFPFSFNFSLSYLTPPLSIQRRFISFLLRRSLGHLLKPGQLDVNQIDAQIGSGFVEIKDLELDCNAINSFLVGLPIQLQSGVITSVTARIPWPNPFSSTIGLSLSGLRLQFCLIEDTSALRQGADYVDDLAESVASVAESFIHDELTQKEEAQLRQSIHEGQDAFDDIPGAMSSFLSQEEELPQKHVNDPEGVSIFAGLFESLLARFDFDASNSEISMVHDNIVLSLGVARVHYFTSGSLKREQSMETKETNTGEKRSVQISGVRLSMRDQSLSSSRPSSPAGSPQQRSSVQTAKPLDDSDSEMDDDTQAMMSQSLACLPPRLMKDEGSQSLKYSAADLAASAASSLYESAVSTAEPSSQSHSSVAESVPQKQVTEATILSILEPIKFELTTPPVASPEAVADLSSPSIDPGEKEEQPSGKMVLEVSAGVVALSLNANHVRGLLCLTNAFSSVYRPQSASISTGSKDSSSTMFDRIDFSLHLQGLVTVVAGSLQDHLEDGPQDDTFLSRFHERPLVPPSLTGGYVRLHVDFIEVKRESKAFTESSTLPSITHQSDGFSPLLLRSSLTDGSLVSCTAKDFSILVYHSLKSSTVSIDNNVQANLFSPLLITDRNLANSYHSLSIRSGARADNHMHPYSDEEKSASLPKLDITDWYSERVRTQGASLRPWRTKVTTMPHYRKATRGIGADVVSNVGISSSPMMSRPLAVDVQSRNIAEASAVSVRIHLGKNSEIASVAVETTPLHLFLNLELVGAASEFIESALPETNGLVPTEPPSRSSSRGRSEDYTDHSFSPRAIEEEKRRLEKLVLEDLDLGMDYLQAGDITPKRRASPPRLMPKRSRGKPQSKMRLDVLVPFVRVEIRAPPPKNRQPRTGSLVLDLHSSRFSKASCRSLEAPRMPRFKPTNESNAGLEEWFDDGSQVPASLEVRRVIVAYARPDQSAAEAVLSLGPIGDNEQISTQDVGTRRYLLPLILFRTAEPQIKPTAVLARIPSLHAAVDKTCLDGLQLWIDDVSQWAERLGSKTTSGSNTGTQVSRTSSLIGSRYFVQRSGSGSTESEFTSVARPAVEGSELVIKLCLSEAFVRLIVPMTNSEHLDAVRYMDIGASDLDTLVEVKPEGKDEMVISLNVVSANIKEISPEGTHNFIISRPLSINRKRPAVFGIRFRSVSLPGSTAKESKVRMILNGLTINLFSDVSWINDFVAFAKTPPGAFESVIPSERTQLSLNVLDCALHITPPSRQSAFVLCLGDVTASTDLMRGESQETNLDAMVSDLSVLLNDDSRGMAESSDFGRETDAEHWMSLGCALLATVHGLSLSLKHDSRMPPPSAQITASDMLLNVHLCADTISGIAGFATDLQSLIPVDEEAVTADSVAARRKAAQMSGTRSTLFRSLDELAFRRPPVIGPLPDMINDDLPRNPEYLDASFGTAAGFRPLEDDEDEFDPGASDDVSRSSENIISKHGGETIKMLHSPVEVIENFFDNLPPSSLDFASQHGQASMKIRAHDCDIQLLLYDGYDWERTRGAIREEVKRVRRRLAKIKQLLASGQTYDPNIDEPNSVLFNSVYVGLDQDVEGLEGEALVTAIDNELAADGSDEASSESSWQSFKPEQKRTTKPAKTMLRTNKLDRVRKASIEFSLRGIAIDYDRYAPGSNLASRLLATVRDLEILDHIKTSTWSTFLTEMKTDSRGNIRETDSNMVRVELQMLMPFKNEIEQEARLKAKVLPLRLHVDQDALDFLKKFFSFKDSGAMQSSAPPENEIFFQHVEIFPVDIKLDYKPRRVDYKALKEGRTIELMNFFHFDGSEMTLRHITLKGVTGWARMFETLNDLWTPDVKANQLVDVISGVSPIRSAVNVGSGMADLVLLPIAQYKKDGRIIRGLQKGATAFMKSTAMEAIRLGARLATGTQVVLEQTENVLGGQFQGPVTAEVPGFVDTPDSQAGDEDSSAEDLYSRYAEQPVNVKEGVQSAYRSLSENIKYAGQTILAVPMEVYENSGTEGPARAVIRAVPIAVLKPMIGASEAISKTLMGLHNTLDPQAQKETETKYKHR